MRKMFLAISSMVVLAGCGGGGSSTTTTDQTCPSGQTYNATSNACEVTPVSNPASVAKASDYTGSWSGTYAVGTGTKTPSTISLTGVDGTKAVTGNVYSALLSGTFIGATGTDGKVSGTVHNKLDNNDWSVTLAKVANALNIVSATYGASSLGTGSCTTTPVMTVNMAGAWKGTLVEVSTDGYDQPITGAVVQVVDVDLAYDGIGFTGAIISDKGLVAKIDFKTASGYWYSEVKNGQWGTVIPTPYHDSLLTQNMITSVTSMTQAFTANSGTPASLQHIIYAMNYSVTYNGTTYPDGGFKKYKLSLARP